MRVARGVSYRSPYDSRAPAGTDLHVRDARLHRHRRPQRDATFELVGGRDPVEADPDAHHVVARPASRSRRRCSHVHGAGRQTASAERVEHRVEARELLGGVRVAGLVGDREVRAHAREPQLGPVDHLRRELDRIVGAAPDAVHAGVDLEVHRPAGRARRDRRPPWRARRSRASVYTTGVSRCATTLGAASGTGSESTRIGASMPASRSSMPSSTSATPNPAAPASSAAGPPAPRRGRSRRPSRRRATRPAHSIAQRPHVGAHRVEIDLGPDRPVGGRHAGASELGGIHVSQGSRPVRNTCSVRGRARTRSDATMSGAVGAARRPARARTRRSRPRRTDRRPARGAPMMPVSTSPVPGGGERRPAGAIDHRVTRRARR